MLKVENIRRQLSSMKQCSRDNFVCSLADDFKILIKMEIKVLQCNRHLILRVRQPMLSFNASFSLLHNN